MPKFRFLSPFPLVIAMLMLISCAKESDDQGTLTMEFTGAYGENAFSLYENYIYHDGHGITFTKVAFYLSPISLIREDGSLFTVSDVEFLDITGLDDPADPELSFDSIPPGQYKGLRLGIGVSEGLNATNPYDYPATHPLANESMYFGPWSSYFFSKTEGRLDTLGNGQPGLSFRFHPGTNVDYRMMDWNHPIEIRSDGTTKCRAVLDLKALLGTTEDHIDIIKDPFAHHPTGSHVSTFVMDRYAEALRFTILE